MHDDDEVVKTKPQRWGSVESVHVSNTSVRCDNPQKIKRCDNQKLIEILKTIAAKKNGQLRKKNCILTAFPLETIDEFRTKKK